MLTRVASVRRRLVMRAAALGACAGAATGAAMAIVLVLTPAVGLGLTVAAAIGAGALARRLGRHAELVDGATWLDRRAGRLDLVASGAAVADGRARRTELADMVLGSATARARAIGAPSMLPAVVAISSIAMIASAMWMRPRPERARVSTADTAQAKKREGAISTLDSGAAGATPALGTDRMVETERTDRVIGEEPTSAVGPAAVLGGRGADATGAGGSAGTIIDADPTVTPATAAGQLAIIAPRAGASAEVAAVPPRYRALVGAYLEAR